MLDTYVSVCFAAAENSPGIYIDLYFICGYSGWCTDTGSILLYTGFTVPICSHRLSTVNLSLSFSLCQWVCVYLVVSEPMVESGISRKNAYEIVLRNCYKQFVTVHRDILVRNSNFKTWPNFINSSEELYNFNGIAISFAISICCIPLILRDLIKVKRVILSI